MTAVATRLPSDPAWPGLTPDDLCLVIDEGIYGEVQDASKRSRGAAIAAFASEAGCSFTEVRCGVRYVRLFTRQDVWDGPGRDRWIDDDQWGPPGRVRSLEESAARAPDEPPADWTPEDHYPVWEFVERSHPAAVRVYVCEVKGSERVLV